MQSLRHLSGFTALAMAASVAAGTLAAGGVLAKDVKSDRTPCFFVTQWQGWKSPSPKVLYLGVNLHDVYRVDLSAGSSLLDWPDSHLVSLVRGSDSVCSAIDLDLYVSDDNGFREPLFPTKLTKLTPEEVAAIPRKYRPN